MEYYKEVIQKVNNLIANKKHNDAFKIISEELSMPYIPLKYEKVFQDLKITIVSCINEKINKNQTTNFDTKTVFEIIQSADNPYITQALSQLRDLNLDTYTSIKKIEGIFFNKNIKNDIKTIIFECLAEQKVNHIFLINTKYVTSNLNPINDSITKNKSYIKNLQLIDKLTNNNPSLQDIAKHFFHQFINNLFPEKYVYENNDEKIFVNIANESLNLEKNKVLNKNIKNKLLYILNIIKRNL